MAGTRPGAWALVVLLTSLFFLQGCFLAARPAYEVRLYTIDYPSPPFRGACPDGVIKIGRFSVAQSYGSPAMVCRPEAFRLTVLTRDRWRTGPGDMVTDYLARDFRSSGLFQAVFSYRQPEAARFAVDGAVEEFLLSREADGWKALMTLDVTLLDLSKPSLDRKIVFQKRYGASVAVPDESAAAFARGMSAAMARVSAEIIRDIQGAVEEAERTK